jgi:predicted methyltransferase
VGYTARTMRALLLSVVLVSACATAPSSSTPATAATPSTPPESPAVRQALDAPDRSAKDRELDAQRHPAEVYSFLGIAPGQKVAELGAGGGWTSEVLARIVGPSGTVYSMNPPGFLSFADETWSARLKSPAMTRVVRVVREFDDPLPPEANNLDAVVMSFIYHDTTSMNLDRDKMNKAIFVALRSGGVFGVLDSSARPGTGIQDAKTLHRIDEAAVKQEVERAGFRLAGMSDVLRNPEDTRDWNSSPSAAGARRGTGDRFVYKFVKP